MATAIERELQDRRRPDRPDINPYGTSISPDLPRLESARWRVKDAIRHVGVATADLRVLPDFLIIGTKRGGTTSLYNYLLAHPNVAPLFPRVQRLKGMYYFDVNYDRGEDWYRSHFPTRVGMRRLRRHHGDPVIVGESTPYYLYHPHAAHRAAALVPDARIIVLLRDPVERAWSHYKERTRQGVEIHPFAQAISLEKERLTGQVERMLADPTYRGFAHQMFSYVDQGRYLANLLRWTDRFEHVLVIRSEDLYASPAETVAEVHRFLGLAEHAQGSYKAWNHQPSADLDPELRAALRERFADDVAALEDHLGRALGWLDAPG